MVLCQFDHGSGLCSQVWRFDSDGAIKPVAVMLTFLLPMATTLWRVFCTDVERSSVLVVLDLWTKNKTGPSQHCPRIVESAARRTMA
jgi:hypothetical protein